jgi:Peptidase family M50/Phosphoribosyl transferase domain
MAIVPVPLHWSRRWWRGGNQAEALAQACVSPEHPMRHLLRRRWATVSQVQRADRVALVQLDRPFVVQGRVPRSVLLVDDVCTTGSTLACCATALRKAGVERVSALVLLLSRGAMKHAMRQS